MTAKLLPLDQIPGTVARDRERQARKAYGYRTAALAGAQFEILDAEGCYSGQPDTYGWLCSRSAAEAVAAEVTHMPGNTCHTARQFRFHG